MISACVLIRTGSGRFDEVLEALRRFKGVRDAFATLGRYDIAVDLEADDWQGLSSTVLRMSRIAGVVFTETLVEVKL
ncbi:MAG: Lrp/AsnC ligand binding domain-containing protein [Candidatus Bathyarchaeia archaeon]